MCSCHLARAGRAIAAAPRPSTWSATTQRDHDLPMSAAGRAPALSRTRPRARTGSVPQPAVEPLPPLDYALREAAMLFTEPRLGAREEHLARDESAIPVGPLPIRDVDVDEAHTLGNGERARSIRRLRLPHEIRPDRQRRLGTAQTVR